MLAGWHGYLQVDAAPAYDDAFAQSPGIIEVGCIAHARRYFKEALTTAAIPCAQALALIRSCTGSSGRPSDRQLDAPARQRLRQEQARPILEKLQGYLQARQAAALPRSPLAAAIGYALRNWVALTRYTEDGLLKIDNNGMEQALRPIVLGRENWLFAGAAGPGTDATRVAAPAVGIPARTPPPEPRVSYLICRLPSVANAPTSSGAGCQVCDWSKNAIAEAIPIDRAAVVRA